MQYHGAKRDNLSTSVQDVLWKVSVVALVSKKKNNRNFKDFRSAFSHTNPAMPRHERKFKLRTIQIGQVDRNGEEPLSVEGRRVYRMRHLIQSIRF